MQAHFNRFLALILAGVAALMLTACGQKGALFIPEDPDAKAVKKAQQKAQDPAAHKPKDSFFKSEDATPKAE